MNFIACTYLYANNIALSAFTGHTRADIAILFKLSLFNSPVPYSLLQHVIAKDKVQTSMEGFHDCIDRLVVNGEANRNQIGNRTFYKITSKGTNTLQRYDSYANQIVKEMICKYADENNL